MRLALLLAACLPALNPAAELPTPLARPAREARRVGIHPAAGQLVCGDLLHRYATRPARVRFTGCTPGQPGSQTVAVATYRVSGASSASAENFFHMRYGMAHLTFVCCGWEPAQGKTGQVASARLRQLNPNYVLVITMYSDAQALEQVLRRGGAGAWHDRRQVKQFIVEVKLLNV